MSTANRVDTSTLGWVKDEIDQTLDQAREALQRYADGDDDLTPLRLFANNIHQVAGTLQMVELDGAAQLAQETESLASAMVSGKVDDDADGAASDLLGEGLSQLSGYMARLARGLPDRPIDNVDVINELRSARRAKALDPYSLFHPDLEVYPARDKAAEELPGDEYARRVGELRRDYQISLLKWLRGQDQEQAWQHLADTVAELFDLSRFQVSMQIWWVARAYLDVLKGAELARDDPRKHPLAQLDQLMRKLVEDSEAAIAREGPEKLVRYMLYHIGRSDVRTDATRSVIQLFDLDTLLGPPPEAPALPEADVLVSLRERRMESLRAVQAALDEYSRSGRADEAFNASQRHLDEFAEAAHEAGVAELADLASGVRDLLFGAPEVACSEHALLAAARALLFIEQTLEHPQDIGADWRHEANVASDRLAGHIGAGEQPSMAIESHEIDAESLDAHELRRLVAAVGGQVESNLKEAEQGLERFAKDAADTDSLDTVVDSLQQVHGAVRMLGQHQLCALLELAIGQLHAIIAGETYATDALIDALAVTIGTTDAYVKGMERDAPNIEALLGRATQELEDAVAEDSTADVDPTAALKQIQDSFEVWIRDNAEYEAFRILRRSLRDVGALAHEQGKESLQRIVQEATNLVDIVMDDPSFLSSEVEETLRRSLATLSELAAPLADATPAAPVEEPSEAPAVEDEVEDDDDDDIMRETFAEEAQECLQAIEAGLGALGNDPADQAALTDIRRSFHTIKGSGRMVKARDIGELAWVVEDTLNRCLDGSVAMSQSVLDLVEGACVELSGMLEAGLDSSTDLQSWRGRAAALQQGDAGDEARVGAGVEAQAEDQAEDRAEDRVDGADSTGTEESVPEPEPVSIDIGLVTPGSVDAPATDEQAAASGALEDSVESVEPAAATHAAPGEADDDTSLRSIEELGDAGHDVAGARPERDTASLFSDDEVIKIFSKEALSHIAAIRSVIDDCNRQGRAAVNDALLRAVHTLRGNARSLHLVEMSEAYSALDTALNHKADRGIALEKSEMPLLDALLVATAKVLDHLTRDKRFPDVVRQELTDIAAKIEATWLDAGDDGSGRRDDAGGVALVSEIVSDGGEGATGDDKPDAGSVFDELSGVERGPAGAAAPDVDAAPVRSAPKPVPETLQGVDDAAVPAAQPAADEAVVDESGVDADLDLKDVFVEEASDILARFESTLQRGRASSMDAELGNMLKRELHTLKGSARAAGMQAIGDLSHDAETMLEGVAAATDPPDDLLAVLEEVHDTLASMIQGLETDQVPAPDSGLVARLRGGQNAAVSASGPPSEPQTAAEPERPKEPANGEARQDAASVALIPEESSTDREVDAPPPAETREALQPQPDDADSRPAPDTPRAAGGRATVRIQSNVLDKLVNYAGEVSISRAQLEEQLSGLKGNLNELRANVSRFSDQVRELDIQADTQIRARVAEEQVSQAGHDFDPLEMDRYSRLQQLSRSLSESVDDLVTIQSGLNRFATQTEGVLSQQAMLNSELQDGLMSARMVPFNTLVPRLRHQARQTARELGKDIDFTVTGAELEVDRNILDQLSEALEHMIRNSLDHGIESAQARAAAGKPARGNLRIDCRQEGNEVLLKFSDDGTGLNVDRIKARAADAGLLSADTDLTDDEVIQLIVLSGFTTAESVTQLSGRGVGLDVVNDAARRLGGSLTLDNRPGEGVSFELRLPLSLSITQAMFVRCGGQRFAIPLGVIETVLKTEPENLTETSKDGDPLFKRDDRVYTLMDLTATLGLESATIGSRVPILLVRMGAREVAVRVDDLVGTDEIVVKQLGDHLGRMSGINGATITGDGSVVVILDLAELWLAQERLPAFRQATSRDADAPPRVMVVDDSLTVRKVTGRNLGRHGMEVAMARDGIDALEQMAQAKPDVMLVDIEMPRMDGYELTTKIREDVNYRDIPIVVITSRAGTKHREKAMELGANAYLTKPYQERELLNEVNALLSGAAPAPVH